MPQVRGGQAKLDMGDLRGREFASKGPYEGGCIPRARHAVPLLMWRKMGNPNADVLWLWL